ncbi:MULTISPECIES: FxSxx-COOH system tetratricopeptide repeat protein [Streptomyces]|uniref:FxSxx-COOH system tetratricopeptide repeat protein n=1 Tax=Streptomyces edwardsiae TaxID=3075527 RepID=A0ABU2PSK4_9ACTN|nr:FxSxx-COOH system tetratricopeptide repeat protein [Streptomyces sp. DSM 41636]MDT0395139.1 FxSxx-COOH system tetratricopeptide repeat protein [Streptomyces sp. DSM 41636]
MNGSPRPRAPGAQAVEEASAGTDAAVVPHWQELADAVWLAAYRARAGEGQAAAGAGPDGEREPARDTPPSGPSETAAERSAPPDDGPDAAPTPLPVPDPEGTGRIRLGPPVLPGSTRRSPGSGRRSAQLAVALHRLARRVPSHTAVELDEEATAERGITDGLWLPWFRPASTRAFDLVLLVDDAPTMAVWHEETASLAAAAEHSGAFRSVRTVALTLARTGPVSLRWNGARTPARVGELLAGRGDRLFMVVTDGLAHGWAGSAADTLLDRLGRAGPTALTHLLPPHMRHRSSLHPYPAVLEAGGLGAANDRVVLRPPPQGPDPLRPLPSTGEAVLPVPVLSLKPGSLAAWADLVTGEKGECRTLPAVLSGTLGRSAPAPGLRAPRSPRAAARAVSRFFTIATPVARRLATRLAAVPFEFDLVEQVRRRTVPEAGPEHLAEILMGGLIHWGADGRGRPEFAEGVREALLATTTRSQLARTVSILGELPAAGAHGVALRAALRDPAGAGLPDASARAWQQSELAVMRALSGPYAERARRIEADLGPTAGVPGDSRQPVEVSRDAAPDRASSAYTDAVTPRPSGDPTETRPGMQTTSTPALLVNVPLRNTSFVGRRTLLQAVEEQLDAQDTAAVLPHALHGLGGVGKSQLVLEYIYRNQHRYKVICWIPAEGESLILAALAGLAARLGVVQPGQEGPASSAVRAVLEALRTGVPYDDWLLVFDNAENIDVVRQYFPTNGPGKVIVTSRNRGWERVATPLPVNVFEREESVELLRKRSPDLSPEDADRLAYALGDLPLAVEQAGAWHAVTGMLVDEYLDLLARRSPDILELDPAPDYPVSVAAAWDISLERIREKNPGARQLLDICASMAPEPIPRSILRGGRGVNITPEVDPLLRESVKLSRAVRDLSQFSLVKTDPRTDTLQMHRLLQTVLLAKLSPEQRRAMREAAHQLLSAAKLGHHASAQEWPAYQALLPHILASQAAGSSDTYVRELVTDTVFFLYYWGNHEGAADLARQAWSAWLADSGEEDGHVIRIAKSLSFTLLQRGQIDEAIPLAERALEVSRHIEVDPEDLVDSLCALADARRHQGRFTEARDLGEEATTLARTQFGADDQITLRATHSWGVDLRLCGQFDEALALDQENARQRESLFGPTSFLTLNTLNALSIDMRESGDYPGARDFQEDVHLRARVALGEDNTLTLRAARNLAVCRRRDGALDEARELTEDTLRRFVARYGRRHSDSLSTAANLSVDQRLAGDLELSRELGEETVRRYTALLGEDHAYTMLTGANLAATLRALGDLDAAREREDDVARRMTAVLGPRHVMTLAAGIGQANTAYARLDFERAYEIDEAGLAGLTVAAGADHPLTLACTANLALDLRGLGRGPEAGEQQRRAVAGFARVVRADHPWLFAARTHRRIECDLAPMPL